LLDRNLLRTCKSGDATAPKLPIQGARGPRATASNTPSKTTMDVQVPIVHERRLSSKPRDGTTRRGTCACAGRRSLYDGCAAQLREQNVREGGLRAQGTAFGRALSVPA
jgi:hypothetical protein